MAVSRFTPAAPSVSADPFDGLLLVDKPAGPTSHDVVNKIRRTFRIPKVGHGGTLDPGATGLLVILLGRGTKLSSLVMGGDKAYTGILRLGVTTNSQDADGEVVSTRDSSGITREILEQATLSFEGDIYQTPPMVSAVKVNGVPLYKLARKGKEVERKPRMVHVYAFRVTTWTPPDAGFDVRCTKGTYVRTLCHEVGEMLGCGAHLRELRRTRSGELSVEDAVPFDTLLTLERDALERLVIPYYRFVNRT